MGENYNNNDEKKIEYKQLTIILGSSLAGYKANKYNKS